jgi:hypothetical protein
MANNETQQAAHLVPAPEPPKRRKRARWPEGDPAQREARWAELDTLCSVQATLREIAVHFGISEDTLERAIKRENKRTWSDYFGDKRQRGFISLRRQCWQVALQGNPAEYFAEKRQRGFISLRRQCWQVALQGNPTMLIWLSKQYLGMAEPLNVSGPGGGPLQQEYVDPAQFTDAELDDLERIIEGARRGGGRAGRPHSDHRRSAEGRCRGDERHHPRSGLAVQVTL